MRQVRLKPWVKKLDAKSLENLHYFVKTLPFGVFLNYVDPKKNLGMNLTLLSRFNPVHLYKIYPQKVFEQLNFILLSQKVLQLVCKEINRITKNLAN